MGKRLNRRQMMGWIAALSAAPACRWAGGEPEPAQEVQHHQDDGRPQLIHADQAHMDAPWSGAHEPHQDGYRHPDGRWATKEEVRMWRNL